LAPRAALLIAALALGGCLKAPSTNARETGCRSCHAPHYIREGACRDCHRGNPDAAREDLAHQRLLTGRAAELRLPGSLALREGQWLVEALACRRCHAIGGRGNGFATSLDTVVWKREQAELVQSIREPVENMPRFGLDEGQAEAIVAFLLKSGSPDRPQDTYRVHFTRGAGEGTTVFEKECGGCHRLLGPTGPLGTGNAGPNLSGLFTEFYPPTAPGNRRWDEKALRDWLRNPRAARAQTTMPPVALGEDDLRKLAAELGLSSRRAAVAPGAEGSAVAGGRRVQ
jgi:mono/diheme cytochrome c family protein